jgi:hypothetical protein
MARGLLCQGVEASVPDSTVEALLTSIRLLTGTHAGRLVAVTVGLPAGAEDPGACLASRLAAAGHGHVAVSARPTSGGPRLLSLEFEK